MVDHDNMMHYEGESTSKMLFECLGMLKSNVSINERFMLGFFIGKVEES